MKSSTFDIVTALREIADLFEHGEMSGKYLNSLGMDELASLGAFGKALEESCSQVAVNKINRKYGKDGTH